VVRAFGPRLRVALGFAALLGSSGCRDYDALDRLFIDAAIGGDAASVGDAMSASDSGTVLLDGETLSLPPGWTVSIYRDISSSYTYNATDFQDSSVTPPEVDDNHPRRLAVLDGDFRAGVVVSLGRDLLEVPDDPTVAPSIHAYRSPADSGNTPDIDSDLDFEYDGSDPANIVVGGASMGAGDGVWLVDSSWNMTNLNMAPNVGTVLYDRVPTVTASLVTPQLYYSQFSSNLPRLVRATGGATIVDYDATLLIYDAEPYDSTSFVLSVDTGTATLMLHLVLAEQDTPPTQLTAPSDTHTEILLVGGAIERLPAAIVNALYDRTSLVAVAKDGTETVLCQTLSGDWQWTHVVVDSGPKFSYLLLEWQPASHTARILRITPS
jgi:hypothetical protein